MKVYIVLFSFFTFIISCHPAYNIFIVNDSNSKIELETQPSIEKRIAIKQGEGYNNLISKKINKLDNFEEGVYSLNPNDSIFLFGSVGTEPGNYLPFNFVKIKKGDDSLKITNNNFLDMINYKKGSKYYIIIN